MNNLETIRDILEEKLEIDREKVVPEATISDLELDSLDLVELVCELEDRLQIDFGDPEDLETVGDILDYLKTR